MNHGRLFAFDEIDSSLELIPLAARRVLDHLGAKLSLEGWRSLALTDRQRLVELGTAVTVSEPESRDILARASPPPRAVDPTGDPSVLAVPACVSERLGSTRTLAQSLWAGLEPLERWVFVKIAQSKRSERLSLVFDEIIGRSKGLTHLNESGEAYMVATSNKPLTVRRAVAKSKITMSPAAHRALLEGNAPKGDVLGVARIAGIMAAKQTSQLIPLCHPLHLTSVEVRLEPSVDEPTVDIHADVTAVDRTGVEMEAMVAASVAALTIYDMLKAVDRKMILGPTVLVEKSGGKSGDFRL